MNGNISTKITTIEVIFPSDGTPPHDQYLRTVHVEPANGTTYVAMDLLGEVPMMAAMVDGAKMFADDEKNIFVSLDWAIRYFSEPGKTAYFKVLEDLKALKNRVISKCKNLPEAIVWSDSTTGEWDD